MREPTRPFGGPDLDPASEDRAVSTTIGYALTLGVTALLITGLLIAGGGFLQDQRVTSTRSELQVVGHQVAADIASADRLTGSDVTDVSISRSLPDRVTGSSYTIEMSTTSQSHLVLTSADPDVTVRVDVQTTFANGGLAETSVDGGDIEVVYNPNGNEELVVRDV
jgi:hypothetical protein